MAHRVRSHSGSLPPASASTRQAAPAKAHPSSSFVTGNSQPIWFNGLPEVLRHSLLTAAKTAHTDPSDTTLTAPFDAMFRGAQMMAGVISDQFHLAARRGQTVGPEIEFLGSVGRTDIIRAIAERYRAAGYVTNEIATPNYEFDQSPNGFWETRHQFKVGESDFAFHLYEGVGGFVVTAKAPFGVQADILNTDNEAAAFERGCVLAAEMLNLPADQIRTAAQTGQRRYLLALKSTDKDYFQVQVEFKPNGMAHISPLTGELPAQDIQATSLDEIKDILLNTVRGKQIPKHNKVTRIEVQVPNRAEPLVIDNRFDVYPIQEVVPSPMAAGERATLMAPLLDFFHSPGTTAAGTPIHLQGTNGVNQVGFHVHREVPWLDANGKPTIEHALKLHRQWLSVAGDIATTLPTLGARKLFARPLGDWSTSVIMDPASFTDPTDVAQMLDYIATVVRTTLPKYHDLNLENWFAHHVKLLLDTKTIKPGDVIESKLFGSVDYTVGKDGHIIMSYSSGGDSRYIDLVRIPSAHPFPTAELRTPDTILAPDYIGFIMDFMAGFGHDPVGTGSKEVAAFYKSIQAPEHATIARDFAKHPGLALSISTLLGLNIPELLIAYRLKGLIGEAAMDAIAPYKAIAADPVVTSVVDAIRTGGLASVLGPDARKDPIAHALDNLLKAGADVSKLVDSVFLDGVIPSQKLGAEIEFNTPLARDPIYQLMAEAYRSIPGTSVVLNSGEHHFNFNAKSPLHWTISQRVIVDGQTIVAKVASGTGGYIISAIRSIDDARMRAANAKDVLGALHEARGLVSELMGSTAHAQTDASPHYLMMCKSEDGDYLKMDVVFKDGKATLEALNGAFSGSGGLVRTLQIPAHNLKDVETFLEGNARAQFAKKDDTVRDMEVLLPGSTEPFHLKLVYEEHPFLEAVTGIMNARTMEVTTPFLDAISSATLKDAQGKTVPALDGNRSGNPLAFQVHAELPYLDAHGKMTVAAFVQLQRNFAAMADSFSAVLAPDPNRVDFAQKTPAPYAERISQPNYVTDPTHLESILNVFGDYVAARPTKYQDMNADHFTSWFLRTLIQQGELQLGQKIITEWHGQTVQFSVRADADGSPQLFRGVTTDGGFIAEQPMIRLSAHQPTVELRLPNAIFAPNGGTADYVNFLMKLTTAFVQRHAQVDSKTIAPTQLGPIEGIAKLVGVTSNAPLQSPKTQSPSAQQGFATVDVMANIATLGAAAAVEKLATLNAQVTATATHIAKGGATFLAGDIGSDLVLGDWERLKNLSLTHVAKDYALLTVGGEPVRMASGAALSPLPIPAAFKAFATRASSLLGAITAQQYGNTGTVDVATLPASVVSIMTASALVQGSVAMMGQVETLSHLGKVLRLAKVGGGISGIGLVVTSVAEFALIKMFGKIVEEADETHRLTALTNAVGTILTSASAIPTALAQGQVVSSNYISAMRTQLNQTIAALEQSLSLAERQVWAEYQKDTADLKEWYRGEMGRTLDGTFSYGEIEDTYRARHAALIKTRDQDLAALAISNPKFVRLPVDPTDDWAAFTDAVDEDSLKTDVDMDGNPLHDDPTPLRYQALLDRNPHVLAAQLTQFRADWEESLKRGDAPKQKPGLPPQVLAQR